MQITNLRLHLHLADLRPVKLQVNFGLLDILIVLDPTLPLLLQSWIHVGAVVLSYYVANVDNLAEIQELTYRDWSNDMSGSNCSVQWSDRQLLRDSSLLSGVLLTKKSLAMTSEHVEMQLILER